MSPRFRSRRMLYLLGGEFQSTVISYHENLPHLFFAMTGLSYKKMSGHLSMHKFK